LKYLIVGAGLSGCVIAERVASQMGADVTLIDRRDHIAGNVYDYTNEHGVTVQQYGPHAFHTDNKSVWDYLSTFTKWRYYNHRALGVIDGKEVPIPFNFDSIYSLFPANMASRIEDKLLNAYEFNKKIPILELKQSDDEELKFLADYIYEKVFLGYTTKQWDLKPEDLDGAVTARIPVYLSRDGRYFQDKYQGIPINGFTKMVENITNHPNIELKLNTDFKDMNESEYDYIVYTGMIDEYFNYEFGELPYRSLEFDIQTLDQEFYQPLAQVNFPNNYDFTRITEFKHYLNEKSEKTTIAIEYPAAYIREKNDPYYPIFTEENQKMYDRYLEHAKSKSNVKFVGRLAEYKYYDMDDMVARALEAFEEIKSEHV
jgi:UDP-galactopyranose mutase